MELSCEYAVVGAGPAGALAAFTLARRGRDVALFDWRPRLEKPCGGGVPAPGMQAFGALLAGVPRNEVTRIRLVGPSRDEAVIEVDGPLAIFARADLDEALRQQASRAGARRVAARVVAVARDGSGWRLEMKGQDERATGVGRARYLVAADGATGPIRRQLLELAGHRPPPAAQFSRTVTTYPPRAPSPVMEIAWRRGIDGYGWSFPRRDHASIGWCEQGEPGGAPLRATLEDLVATRALHGDVGAPGVGALIPSFRGATAERCLVEGDRFALVGDAAGAVDPITREGIHHALASGAALGEEEPLEHPGAYARWYDAAIRPEIVAAARLAPIFFGPRFLTTMVRALQQSESLREVFRDLIAGRQRYAELRGRLLRSLPWTLLPLLGGLLHARQDG